MCVGLGVEFPPIVRSLSSNRRLGGVLTMFSQHPQVMWERELAMAANRHLAAVRKANVHPTMFGGVRIRHSGHPQTFARRVLLNGHRNLLRRLRLSGYHVLPTYSRNEAMEWEKYKVYSLRGKCL